MAAERRKCFRILGLQEGASEVEIRKAYKQLALQYHPDKNESDDAHSKFQEIGYAYKYLTEGPNAFGTTDPHDVREEFLRRMFEEMFFAQFRGPFGGFSFYCEESDDDEYYMYSDSNDSYCGSSNKDENNHYAGRNRSSYQNTTTRTQHPTPNHPPLSKKQLRKREKKQRQKERAKEHKAQQRNQREKQPSRNLYTDDVNPEQKGQATGKPVPKDDTSTKSEDKTDTGSSRPDTPVLNQSQPQKMNKKQKKKMESEQRKREKEMEEIAAELRKKQEREMEKLKEKERLAAQKREEEKENEIDFNHMFDYGKKSRKARQREKKRQESGINQDPAQQREGSASSVHSEKPLYNMNFYSKSSTAGKPKQKNETNMKKNTGPKPDFKKPQAHHNRFDILDDIDDDFSRPGPRDAVSSSGSQRDTDQNGEWSRSTDWTSQNFEFSAGRTNLEFSGHCNNNAGSLNGRSSPSNVSEFAGQNSSYEGMKQFKSGGAGTANDFSYTQKHGEFGTRNKTSMKGDNKNKGGNANINYITNDKNNRRIQEVNSNLSAEVNSGLDEFEEIEQEFVKDWSVFNSDEENDLDDFSTDYGTQQNDSNNVGTQNNHQYSGWKNIGNKSSYYQKTEPYQPNGYPPQRREFIPRTRGFHSPDFGPYGGYHPGFRGHVRGPPPFQRGGMYRPPPHPHFRGGFPTRPTPRFRGGGYAGQPRYGPPNAHSYGRPPRVPPPGFFSYPNHGADDGGKKNKREYNKTNNDHSSRSFGNDFNGMHNVREDPSDVPQSDSHIGNVFTSDPVREPSTDFCRPHENEQQSGGQFANNIFSNSQENQAASADLLDSVDDFIVFETQPGFAGTSKPSSPSTYQSVDIGLDEFLSKDILGVPAGMCSESMKNYYK